MSSFDPNAFLEATFTAPNTKRSPLPATEYTGVVKELKTREWTSKKDPTQSGPAVDIVLSIDIPVAIRESIGLDASSVTLTDSILLDKDPTRNLKNNKIRMYREAIDKNKVGDSFKLSDLVGKLVSVKIKHEPYNDSLLEKVASVGKL